MRQYESFTVKDLDGLEVKCYFLCYTCALFKCSFLNKLSSHHLIQVCSLLAQKKKKQNGQILITKLQSTDQNPIYLMQFSCFSHLQERQSL